MVKKKFHLYIIAHILVLIGLTIFLTYNIQQEEKLFTLTGTSILIFLVSLNLLKQTNRLNKNILSFFDSIKYEDYTFRLKEKQDKDHKNLANHLDQLNNMLSEVRIEHEIKSHYLNTIVEHITVGLIAIKSDGEVDFFNAAAQKLLHLHRISHIETISSTYPEFGNILQTIKPGQQKLIKLKTPEEIKYITLKASNFYSRNQLIKLFTFQDIQKEIEETEAETWKKLIRVLTHEINNSMSPIHSLADSLNHALNDTEEIQSPLKNKALESLQIIRERSQGLLEFVDKFRNMTPKSELHKELFPLNELFYRVRIIAGEYAAHSRGISINSSIYPDALELNADKQYVEQILINLVKNAMEAIPENIQGSIELKAFRNMDQIVIEITDNGNGIDEEEREKIFTPFYSTKKQGSGIGLSLSRQIMLMHGGHISLHSEPGRQTIFSLHFPSHS
ncbi:MAG: ATP-binding protein [Bacteroidales bacterium]